MNASSSCLLATQDADAAPPTPAPGDVVSGKYVLGRLLGEGGMGLVFEAVDARLRRRVAIKFVRPDVLAKPDAVERFEREARAIGSIEGPHVARVIDEGRAASGAPYMVMDLLRGRDLEAELRARGALAWAEATELAAQICEAVSAAHAAGVVHRDLKPSNVFLCDEGDGAPSVRLLDFGVSKTEGDDDPADRAGLVVGTPVYMAPEQMRCAADVDARADVWSLGVILFEMLAGVPPFHGTTTAAIAALVADASPCLRDVCHDAPAELERIVKKAMAKDPAQRYGTAKELARDLAALQRERVSGVRARLWPSGSRGRAAVACAVAFLLSAGAGTLVRVRAKDPRDAAGAHAATAATSVTSWNARHGAFFATAMHKLAEPSAGAARRVSAGHAATLDARDLTGARPAEAPLAPPPGG